MSRIVLSYRLRRRQMNTLQKSDNLMTFRPNRDHHANFQENSLQKPLCPEFFDRIWKLPQLLSWNRRYDLELGGRRIIFPWIPLLVLQLLYMTPIRHGLGSSSSSSKNRNSHSPSDLRQQVGDFHHQRRAQHRMKTQTPTPTTRASSPTTIPKPSPTSVKRRQQQYASRLAGRTPPLFLQELAHLCSLLVAVAYSTLRNDIDGAESPLGL
jgi:hypothetical protein